MSRLKLTIVAPVFNEAQGIGTFHKCARSVLDNIAEIDARIVYVIDRSTNNPNKIL